MANEFIIRKGYKSLSSSEITGSLNVSVDIHTPDVIIDGHGSVSASLSSIIANDLDGAGTANYISKFTDTDTLADSIIFDSGTNIGIGILTDGTSKKLTVAGEITGSDIYINGWNSISSSLSFISTTHTNFSASVSTRFEGLTTDYTELDNIPDNIISSSLQVDHDQTTNFVAGEHFLQSGIITVGTVTTGNVTAILPANTVSSSAQIASDISGSITSFSGSVAARFENNESSIGSLTGATGSYLLNTTDTLTGDLTVTGTVTAQEFHTEIVSASIIYESGSSKFGDSSDDNHDFTGSLNILGNITSTGDIDADDITIDDWGSVSASLSAIQTAGGVNGTGTANRIAIWSDSDTLTSNSGLTFTGGHILVNQGTEYRSKDTAGSVRTLMRVNNSNELEYGWSSNGAVKFMGGGSYTERMRIHTDGNVGIGTTSPSAKLNVVGTGSQIGSTGYYYNAFFRDTTNSGVLTGGNNTSNGVGFLAGVNELAFLTFGTSWGERMRITGAGNVGIGTTSPYAKLEITGATPTGTTGYGDNANSGQLYITSNAGVGSQLGGRIAFGGIAGNGGGAFNGTRQDSVYGTIEGYKSSTTANHAGGGLSFKTNFNNSGALTERMNIDQAGTVVIGGNVGIGTTSPTDKLNINTGVGTFDFKNYGLTYSTSLGIRAESGYLGLVTEGADDVFISTNGFANKRFVVKPSGNVGIGTINPSAHLDVVGNIRIGTDSEHAFQITDDSTNNFLILSSTQRTTASAARDIKFRSYGTDATDSVLVMDMSSGNVGVGIDTPNYPLEVNGTSTVSIAYQRTGVSAKKWGFHSDNGNTYWQNLTDGNLALTISNAGNVGIGTTGPSSLSANTTSLSINSTRTDLTGGIFLKANGTNKAQYYWDSSGQVNETLAGDIRWFVGNTERMRIKSTGNVGIGTSNPIYPLEVQSGGVGTVLRAGTSFVSIDSVGTASSPSLIFNGDDNTGIFRAASDTLGFSTGGSERLRITSTGDIGIGTTSPVGDLHLYGGQQNIVLTNTNADGVAGLTISRIIGQARGYSNNLSVMQSIDFVTNASAWYKGDIVFRTNSIDGTDTTKTAAERMRINSAGNVGIGTSNPGSKLQVSGDIDSDDITIDGWGSVSGSLASIATAGGVNGSGTTNDVVMWSGANSISDAPIAISGNNATFAGNITVNGNTNSIATGNTGTFITNDTNNYPRITLTNSSAQIGLFRSGGNAGGMYIGGSASGFRVYTTGFAQKLLIDQSGNATFAGTITATKGFFNAANNQISIVDSDDNQDFRLQVNGGIFSVRDHTNSQTIFKIDANTGSNALHLDSSGATFAGNVVLGDSSNTTMAVGAPGQLQVKGAGYTGAVALDATAMYIYHDSALRDLVLGTNETARLTIDGNTGNATFTGNVAMASGNATGKFAVKSSAVHGSYDFYNNGTTYLNGSTYVDAAFTQSGGADSTFSGDVLVEDNLYLTDAGTVRGKIQLNSSDRDNLDIKAMSLGSLMRFYTVDTLALTLDASQNATFAGDVSIGGNLIGASNNTTELGTYTTGAIKRIRMAQGGELHFGDTTTSAPLGITEGSWDSFGDHDRLSIYGRSSIKFYAGSTAAVLAATLQSTGLTLNTITNATSDTDKFLVSDSGIIKYRTGAELLSDIGAVTTSTLGSYLPLTAGSTKKLTDTLYIQGTNTTNAESVLVRGVSSNDGDWLGSIRTANTGGYNQEMRFYTSDANGTTNENLTLTLSPNKNATFAGNGTFDTSLKINAPDGGGAPAMTAILNMHGYEGRGVGIKMKDNVNSAAGSTDREWFIGTGYSNSGFNIGYAADGSQSSYNAQAKLSIGTNGDALFSNNVTVTGDLTVNGTTTTINTATVEVEDNIIVLNKTASDGSATAAQSGISINRGGSTADASFIFDDTDDFWDLTHNLNVATDIQAQDLGLGVNPVRFGTGVPTLHLKGTTSTNGRGGAIRFQEFDGTDTTALYSTDGGDGYGTVLCAYQGSIKLATGALTGTVLELDQSNNATFQGSVYLKAATNEGNLFFGTADANYKIFGGGTYGYMGYNTGGYHRFLINGSEKFKINSSGNSIFSGNIVLPGEESNSFKIAFTGASASSGLSTVDQSGAGLYIGANSRVNTSGNVVYHDSALPSSGIYFDGWNGDDMEFYTGTSGNPSKRLTISGAGDANFSGKIGIGTTTAPTYDIDIHNNNGRIRMLGGTGYVSLDLQNNGQSFYLSRNGATVDSFATGNTAYAGILAVQGNYNLEFATNGAVRQTINGAGNVGIGTASPGAKLDIKTSIAPFTALKVSNYGSNVNALYAGAVDDTYLFFGSGFYYNSSKFRAPSTTAAITSYDSGAFRIFTDSGLTANTDYTPSERMRITSGGNVGIGETGPDGKLHIKQTGSGTLNTIITEDNARKLFIGRDAINCKDLNNNNAILFLNQAGGNVSVPNSSLGIGTTTPVSLLHIKGADPILTIQDTSTGTANASSTLRLGESGSGGVLDVYWDIKQASDDLNTHLEINHSSNGNHFTILDNGNVGIDTTSPVSKLQVNGGIQMADDTATASADKVGTMRYRTGTEFVEDTGINLDVLPAVGSTTDAYLLGAYGSNTATYANRISTLTYVDNSGGGYHYFNTSTNMTSAAVVNNYYTAKITFKVNTGTIQWHLYTGASYINSEVSSGTAYQTMEITFQAKSATNIFIKTINMSTGQIVNVSLCEIYEVTEEDASYADMCMQTGASTYEWVNIVRNTY